MEENEKAFKELISYSSKLDKIEYADIRDLIKESVRHIPITTAKLYKNTPIDRARINGKTRFFNKEDDLTYIKDKSVIKKRLLEFGRANKPHEPLFYGALESSLIKQNRLTAFLETSTLLRDTKSVCLDGQLFTLSRWVTNEELIIAEIVFSDDAIKNNPDTLKSFLNHFEQIKTHPMREFGLRQLQFFSNEFSKEVKTHHDYKICVAYSDLLLNDYGIAGITYPSVQSGYQGQNLVLRTDIVDKHLDLYSVSTHRMHKDKMESVLGNYFHTKNFGKNNSSFVWDLKECDEEKIKKDFAEKVTNANSK